MNAIDINKYRSLESRRRPMTGINPAAGLGRPQTGVNPAQFGKAGPCAPGSGATKYLAFQQDVTAGASVTITRTPQESFRATLVVIPSSLGLLFTVGDISVATTSQNVRPNSDEVLAQVFSEASGGMGVCFDEVCSAGVEVSVRVTSLSMETETFYMMMIGYADKYCR